MTLLTPSSEMTIHDKRDVWWQPQEFDSFLEDAKVLAIESRRLDASDDEASYAQVLLSIFRSCKESNAKGPSRKQRYRLSQWTKVAYTRRGLERICVKEIGVTRSRQKQEVIQGVLRAQGRLKKNASPEDKEFLLSAVSRSLTRPARLYAAVMGEADANASDIAQDLKEITWRDFNEALSDNSSPKVMASLRMGVRILRRASNTGVSRISRERKRRRSAFS